ncbi:Mini-ribonuclease 3 [Hominenteromicrobium sp.]|uniref:Mini-ribonuclease 3 n=1 Tax=Hominenteromicrobium sp. TaxID=3073581 RepID=UPI0039919AB6
MEKFYQTESDPKQLSPLTLAYVGDGVYELFVREYIVSKGNCPVKKLHSRAVSFVRCEFQARCLVKLAAFHGRGKRSCLRGRNAHVSHVPKNSSVADYHAATAFECFFGYLYLKGELSGLRLFFEDR